MNKKSLVLFLTVFMFPIYTFAESVSDMDSDIDTLQGVGFHDSFHNFLNNMKKYASSEDKSKIAEMISYPINITVDSRTQTIYNKKEFIKNYDNIFTKHLLNTLKNQKYEDLIVKDIGAGIGRGELWFGAICPTKECKTSKVEIMQINTTSKN